MDIKEKAIYFYNIGLYSKEQLHVFVTKGLLTEAEYTEITKE